MEHGVWNRTLALDLTSDHIGVVGPVGSDQTVTIVLEQGLSGAAVSRFPGVIRKALGWPSPPVNAWSLVVRPPRRTRSAY